MNTIEKYSKEIVDYLYKDMTNQEKLAFEEILIEDIDLARELVFQKEIANDLLLRIKYEEILADKHINEAKKLASEIVAERNTNPGKTIENQEPVKKTIPLRTYLSAVAAMALILIVSSILLIHPNPEKLYQQFYTPFTSAGFNNRSDLSAASLHTAGINAYFKGDYSSAIEDLSRLKTDKVSSPDAEFILGLSFMGNEEYSEAIEVFSNHLEKHFALQTEVKWYLGLCYIRIGELEKALDLTGELSHEGGKFGNEAKKLSNKLEKSVN